MTQTKTIELYEYQTRSFPEDEIPQDVGKFIWSQYSEKIAVEAPTFQTDSQWRFTSQGWVGHIPLTESYRILLKPKVELENLFRMLEYAYRIPFETMGDVVGASSLVEFYDRLAHILALRVADRVRKGLYREYASREQRLPFVRGKLDLNSMLTQPWEVDLDCHYHKNTSDIEENQIIAWTLFCIARSGLCGEEVGRLVRRAYRGMCCNIVRLGRFNADACVGRFYNRLNQDYEPIHGLCRFFLENTGPTHEQGENAMLPFLVDMPRLFETFVTEWLRAHLPENILLKDQVTIQVGSGNKVDFRIDLLLTDRHTGKPLCLLDTKYKAAASPSPADVKQVIAYAKALGCNEAILVYPKTLDHPFEANVGGDIHVWTTDFTIAKNLETNGESLLRRILAAAFSHLPETDTRWSERKIYINKKDLRCLNKDDSWEKKSVEKNEVDEKFRGWRKSPYSLTSVLADYSHIWVSDGYILTGYQFCSEMGSSGFAFAIPNNKELPDPPVEELDFGWLETGEVSLGNTSALPDWVRYDIGRFLQGDRSPVSYLEASLCMRALRETGAGWHGLSWSTHQLIASEKFVNNLLPQREEAWSTNVEWEWPKGKPTEWRPCVYKGVDGSVIVTFYTYSELGQQAIYLHRDTYKRGYEFESKQEIIGTGSGGYIF